MNQRSWVWVGLFGGLAVVLLVWLLLSGSDPSTEAASARARAADERSAPRFRGPNPETLDEVALAPRKMDPALMEPRADRLPGLAGNPLMAQLRAKARREAEEAGDLAPFGLDPDGIRDAVERRRPDLEACYETALFHEPELEGQVVLTLTVEPVDEDAVAAVTSVRTDSELDATILEGCLATVFEELRFEADELTTIRYPIDLAPDSEAP